MDFKLIGGYFASKKEEELCWIVDSDDRKTTIITSEVNNPIKKRYVVLRHIRANDKDALLFKYSLREKFSHAHVLKPDEIFSINSKCYAVVYPHMPLTLEDYLKGNHSLEKLKEISLQLLNAVNYIHSKGILHFKIACSTIRYHDGNIFLAGFSCATSFPGDINFVRKSTGINGYVFSPEYLHKNKINKSHDWYMVGVVFARLFNRKVYNMLRSDQYLLKIYRKSLKLDLEPKSPINTLLSGLLCLTPHKRFTYEEALNSDFFSSHPK